MRPMVQTGRFNRSGDVAAGRPEFNAREVVDAFCGNGGDLPAEMAISNLGRTPVLVGSSAPAAVRRELAATAPAPRQDLEHETPQAAFERLKRRLIRLGFDIHDGPLQSLAAAGFGLKDLQQRLPAGEPGDEAARILGDIIAELADAERSLRSLAGTLEDGRPEIPLARDILAGELKRFARRSPAQVDVHGNWLYHPDSRSQALTIKALLRESLTNVAKHAGAHGVVVRLQASSTHVLLEIEDDGRGFEPAEAGGTTIGLASMHERVRLLGGDLEILSRAGGPTVVTAAIIRYRQPSRAESYTAPPLGGVA
jgi:signal transduction histidine kinase